MNFRQGVCNCVIVSKQYEDFLIPSLASAVAQETNPYPKMLRIFLTAGACLTHLVCLCYWFFVVDVTECEFCCRCCSRPVRVVQLRPEPRRI